MRIGMRAGEVSLSLSLSPPVRVHCPADNREVFFKKKVLLYNFHWNGEQ
jgi:hypothetical protein